MPDSTDPIRAPQDATGWTPSLGWLYDPGEVSRAAVERGELVLVVSDDGYVRGVVEREPAQPIRATMRIDADLVDVVTRLEEVAGRLGGRVAAVERETVARLAALVHRVDTLEDRAAGFDTGLAVEVAALKTRVRRLEDATR